MNISIFIITKNEEDRIGHTINDAKKVTDDIIIIDSGSSDKTIEISENLGVKTFYNEWNGYGKQKIFGESLCKSDWVLNIDADEEITDKLANEIKNISVNDYKKYSGFRIKIVNKFFGEEKPKRFAYYYNQLRLYNKNEAGFKNSFIHDSVELKNKYNRIGQLKNIIEHQSFRSISHWIEKINSYSTMQAIDSYKNGKIPSLFKIIFTPIFAFFKAYFIRRYFIYGVNGVVYSGIFAFSRLIKLLKIKEMVKNHEL